MCCSRAIGPHRLSWRHQLLVSPRGGKQLPGPEQRKLQLLFLKGANRLFWMDLEGGTFHFMYLFNVRQLTLEPLPLPLLY